MPSKQNIRGWSLEAAESQAADRATMVYHTLRDLIVHGKLAPGSRIIETEIADRLGVSRTPIRSALQRLQQEGFIVSSGTGRQMRPLIAPLTREDARDLLGIVGALEGMAARWAAELDDDARARLVADLESTNQTYLRTSRVERPDSNELFDLDTRFHSLIVEAGAGPRLRGYHDTARPQVERYVRLYVSALVDEIETSVQEHEVIIREIARGDGAAAQDAVQANWRNATERMSRVIDTIGERGSW